MTFFIDETYIKEVTPICNNVDPKILRQILFPTQDVEIQQVLGTNYYKYLLNQVATNTTTADEDILIDMIKPCLAYKLAGNIVKYIASQITNKGPQRQTSDNSTYTDNSANKELMLEMLRWADFYENRLKVYLDDNKALYPLYVNSNDTDLTPETNLNYNFGFAFPKSGGCNNNNLLYIP